MEQGGVCVKCSMIWMSPDTARGSRFGLHTLGGILGIAALMLALTAGGVWLSFRWLLPREAASLALVCAVTALGTVLALRLGRRTAEDAAVFFLTEDDRLFLADARTLFGPDGNVLDYAADAMRTQAFLRRLADRPYVPAGAGEILKVERIWEKNGQYAVRCRVRRSGGTAACTRFLARGMEDEELLLRQLERRQRLDGGPELAEDRSLLGVLASALVLAGCAALCALSHPAVGRLPRDLYFPCLGAAFLALFPLAYFLLRRRRG